jgi:hypothetical protein
MILINNSSFYEESVTWSIVLHAGRSSSALVVAHCLKGSHSFHVGDAGQRHGTNDKELLRLKVSGGYKIQLPAVHHATSSPSRAKAHRPPHANLLVAACAFGLTLLNACPAPSCCTQIT